MGISTIEKAIELCKRVEKLKTDKRFLGTYAISDNGALEFYCTNSYVLLSIKGIDAGQKAAGKYLVWSESEFKQTDMNFKNVSEFEEKLRNRYQFEKVRVQSRSVWNVNGYLFLYNYRDLLFLNRHYLDFAHNEIKTIIDFKNVKPFLRVFEKFFVLEYSYNVFAPVIFSSENVTVIINPVLLTDINNDTIDLPLFLT